MQIKNIGHEARTLSRAGKDYPLMPGASVDLPLTEDDAKAFRAIGFGVTGEPEPAKPAAKIKD